MNWSEIFMEGKRWKTVNLWFGEYFCIALYLSYTHNLEIDKKKTSSIYQSIFKAYIIYIFKVYKMSVKVKKT